MSRTMQLFWNRTDFKNLHKIMVYTSALAACLDLKYYVFITIFHNMLVIKTISMYI